MINPTVRGYPPHLEGPGGDAAHIGDEDFTGDMVPQCVILE
jgi:hypothetical protein